MPQQEAPPKRASAATADGDEPASPDQSQRASRIPWIVATVAGLIFVVLLVLYYAILRPYGRNHTSGEFTATENTVLSSAATDVTNILSYRRAHFSADYSRALASVTGEMKTDVTKERTATLKAMTAGKFDLSAKVTHQALVGPVSKGDGYVVLIVVNGYRSSEPAVPMAQNLQVTVTKIGGKWLLSDLQSVAVS